MNNKIEIVKESKRIGNMGIERLGYVKFVNGQSKQTTIEVMMNVNMRPTYYVKNTGFSTQYFEDITKKYAALRNIEEIDLIGKFF